MHLRQPHSAFPTLFAAYRFGGSLIGAILIATIAGALTLRVGQYAFAIVRTPTLRLSIRILFAIPAAVVGYNATLEFAHPPMSGLTFLP
jgi:hypothetical protein